MKIRKRITAILIKNNKLLLLKGYGSNLLWTPGGRIEKGETDVECLKRELKEELGVELASHKYIGQYTGKTKVFNNITKSKMYLIDVKGRIKAQREIEKCIWLSIQDFKENKYEVVEGTEDVAIRKIIDKKIWH